MKYAIWNSIDLFETFQANTFTDQTNACFSRKVPSAESEFTAFPDDGRFSRLPPINNHVSEKLQSSTVPSEAESSRRHEYDKIRLEEITNAPKRDDKSSACSFKVCHLKLSTVCRISGTPCCVRGEKNTSTLKIGISNYFPRRIWGIAQIEGCFFRPRFDSLRCLFAALQMFQFEFLEIPQFLGLIRSCRKCLPVIINSLGPGVCTLAISEGSERPIVNIPYMKYYFPVNFFARVLRAAYVRDKVFFQIYWGFVSRSGRRRPEKKSTEMQIAIVPEAVKGGTED